MKVLYIPTQNISPNDACSLLFALATICWASGDSNTKSHITSALGKFGIKHEVRDL
jgi:hypothetical protein